MRKLAYLTFSFSATVFLANYWLPETWLLKFGAGAAILCPVVWLILRRKLPRWGAMLALCCAGVAAGTVWTACYTEIFFRPAQALDDRTVVMTATVADWPQETDYGYSVLVRADTDTWVTLSTVLYTDEQGKDLRPGDQISTIVHCTLGDRTFSGKSITYYTAKGIFLRGKCYGRLEMTRPDSISPRDFPAMLSKQLKDSIDRAFPSDVSGLVRALVTGNRDNLTDEYTTSLQRTGLSHTVAVSGMHLAFLASALSLLLGKGKRSTAVAVTVGVVIFCGVAGNTPSVLRAAIMILLLQAAPLLGRERDDATALGMALALLLFWNPFSAAHIGLQLSFGAVAGILLTSDRIQNWMLTRLGLTHGQKNPVLRQLSRLPRFFVSTLSATLGASILTVPLAAGYFGTVSLISPVSNLLTLWAVALLFLGGLSVGLLGMALPAPAALLALPFTYLARYLNWVVVALARIPLAALSLDFIYYRAWLAFVCVLLVLTLGMRGRKRPVIPICAGIAALAAAMVLTVASFHAGAMTAVVLDVGQGQSVLLRVGNFLTLMDCGGDASDDAGDIAADYIQALGRSKLDLLVVSHCHADHANGIPQLLRRLQVSAIALPDVEEDSDLRQEILDAAAEQGVEVWLIGDDTQISLDEDQDLTIFAPLGDGGETNERGLSLLARSGEVETLITGDMNGDTEQLLLAHTELPHVELLVVGHHGSQYSTTQELLDTVCPEIAVISVGENNRYGHPGQETLERLRDIGAEIYRTDRYGTVTLWLNDPA